MFYFTATNKRHSLFSAGPTAKKPAVPGRPNSRPLREEGVEDESETLMKRLERAGVDPKLLTQVLSSIVSKDQVGVRCGRRKPLCGLAV